MARISPAAVCAGVESNDLSITSSGSVLLGAVAQVAWRVVELRDEVARMPRGCD